MSFPQKDEGNKILQPAEDIFLISDGEGGWEKRGRSNMMYNMGLYYLEFPQWLQMTIEKSNLICFVCYIYYKIFYYLIYMMQYTKVILNLHSQGLLILSDFNWN